MHRLMNTCVISLHVRYNDSAEVAFIPRAPRPYLIVWVRSQWSGRSYAALPDLI